jgi:hypothetical protein
MGTRRIVYTLIARRGTVYTDFGCGSIYDYLSAVLIGLTLVFAVTIGLEVRGFAICAIC